MDKKFLFKLAVRNLLTHRLRTILTLVGVVIGISAVVFLVSLGSGIQKLVTERITGGDAFELIDVGTGNSQVVRLNAELIDKIKTLPDISQVETITNLAGKAINGDKNMDVAFFGTSGLYLDWAGKKIRYGNNLPILLDTTKKAVVNTSYLEFMTDEISPNEMIGKEVVFDVIVPKELSTSGEPVIFSAQKFTIIGVIKDDASPSIYTNFENLDGTKLISYSQAKVRLSHQNKAEGSRKQIETFGLRTQYVGDTVAEVQQVFSVFKIVLGSFGVIALLVALLGMFNTLTISLMERIKEVALMKILGMSSRDIRNLFVTEALTLGLIGGVLGIVWGVLMGKVANYTLNYFAARSGADPVTVFYYSFSLIFYVIMAAVLVGLITGFYPARRAAKVSPLDVIRYE